MIDEKTLADEETRLCRLTSHYAAYPDVMENMMTRIEIIRLARRYLALQRSGVAKEVVITNGCMQIIWSNGAELDAAADRLLENKS